MFSILLEVVVFIFCSLNSTLFFEMCLIHFIWNKRFHNSLECILLYWKLAPSCFMNAETFAHTSYEQRFMGLCAWPGQFFVVVIVWQTCPLSPFQVENVSVGKTIGFVLVVKAKNNVGPALWYRNTHSPETSNPRHF